jgi:arginyl-tRNA synthetase
MNFFSLFRQKITKILSTLQNENKLPLNLDLTRIAVEPPKDPHHGEIATNAAMVLAKSAGMPPRQLAELLIEHLNALPEIAATSIAGPGFINLKLTPLFWQQQLQKILQEKLHYGDSQLGQGEAINVEFVSANPTGPMHAGHGRNAVLGDAICALLMKVGYQVTREYYINDAGSQTETLARSTYLRYLQALGHTIEESCFEGLYPGNYLVKVGHDLAKEFGELWVNEPEAVWLEPIRIYTINAMMDLIKQDLNEIGVHMDVYRSEQDIIKKGGVEQALQVLEQRGDLYIGTLEKPKGHDVEEWEPRPQTLFRSTAYGDDVDRPLKKSDGSWTYFASDIAYHYDKFQRGFTKMIDVLSADHGGYFKRIQAACKAVTSEAAEVEVKCYQLVNFLENGLPVKMSKRSGTFITLKDVIDRVGKDVTRFIMLTRRHDMIIDFDFQKVIEQTKDNPIFYVQYAHARCHSVLRHSLNLVKDLDFHQIDLAHLTEDVELAIIKLLASWPQQVETAAVMREPHRIANYLYDVAAAFHGLWNKGKENAELRFIEPDNLPKTYARLALVQAVAFVIASGLNLFGITPVEEMRS